MIYLEKVEKKNFSTVDLLDSKIADLVALARDAGDVYALKMETDIKDFTENENYVQEVSPFKLNRKDGTLVEVEGRQFPFGYQVATNSDFTPAIMVDYESEDIDYLVDHEKNKVETKLSFYYNINGELNVENLVVIETNRKREFTMYLDSRISVNGKVKEEDVAAYSNIDLEGSQYLKIATGHLDNAKFEYMIIISRCANLTPLLYGYLETDCSIYKVVAGEFCTGKDPAELIEAAKNYDSNEL